MKTREERIEFDRNYCTHYSPEPGKTLPNCTAGMDISSIQKVETTRGIKWGPCIGGHTLACATDHCPKWERRSLEQAEGRADEIERAVNRMKLLSPVLSAWRKKLPIGKQEVIDCPVCGGKLHLSQARSNGHIRGLCRTDGCVNFIE